MAQEVKDLGAEIERLEQQAQIEAQLSAPTSSPVHADPKSGAKKDVKPTATAEYAANFWNMIRNRGHYGEVRNALSVGEDTEGGFTVPDEFEKKLVEALEENNIFRGMATVIRTSSGTRKCAMTRSKAQSSISVAPEASSRSASNCSKGVTGSEAVPDEHGFRSGRSVRRGAQAALAAVPLRSRT